MSGKDEKTRKTRERPAEKVLMGNTFEQYAGLKSAAASRFSEKTFSFLRKVQNHHFLGFEQYGRLESRLKPGLTDSGGQE